ncbi:hypothetical protein ABID41_003684 [Phenylobacterium koreense]|uniref:Uncharacterized protein n=1 Tax=Phenylobacterium koreense TaxID=266125 RepID=A0ABV2EPH2_9CAUL
MHDGLSTAARLLTPAGVTVRGEKATAPRFILAHLRERRHRDPDGHRPASTNGSLYELY